MIKEGVQHRREKEHRNEKAQLPQKALRAQQVPEVTGSKNQRKQQKNRVHQKHAQSDDRCEKAQIHRRVKSGEGILFHKLPPFNNKKWLWCVKNVTITILGKHFSATAGLPTRISDECALCLLRGFSSNDRLSPTNAILDAHGIG
jgi:hypothetical protein